MKKIRILALSWRDIKSPTAGGAEVNTHEIFRRLDPEVYEITHIAPLYEGLMEQEVIDGIRYMRHGNVATVIPFARRYYKKHRSDFDYVIDQCNTHRFFTPRWVEADKRIFLIYQLTREIWDINMKPPFSTIGRIMETPLLRMNRFDVTITESESTKTDLVEVGFDPDRIKVIPVIMKNQPWPIEDFLEKSLTPSFVYVGRFVKYKGIDQAIEAYGRFAENMRLRDANPGHLYIVGKKDDNYIKTQLLPICHKYQIEDQVVFLGYVSEEEKLSLLSKSTALVFPSNREGWGIPVSEAAFVGTPSIVFRTQGLIDAVDYGRAGYLCEENTAEELMRLMMRAVDEVEEYETIRKAAYTFSTEYLNRDINSEFQEVMNLMDCERRPL